MGEMGFTTKVKVIVKVSRLEAHSTPPSSSTHADVLGGMGLGWICHMGLEFTLVPITLRYSNSCTLSASSIFPILVPKEMLYLR